MGGPYTQKMAQAIEAEGVPVFQSVGDWIAAARWPGISATMKPLKLKEKRR